MLLGYVEYLGLHRVVICFSQSYTGPALARSYALDPMTGKTMPVRVDLPFSAADVQAIYNSMRKFRTEGSLALLRGCTHGVEAQLRTGESPCDQGRNSI